MWVRCGRPPFFSSAATGGKSRAVPAPVTPAWSPRPSRTTLTDAHMDLHRPILYLFRWLNVSGGLLVVLLQRTPALRNVLATQNETVARIGSLLRATLAPAAALGAVHTLAGATNSTQLVANVALPAKATVGQPFSMSVVITGKGVSFAQSWDVTNTLPPGITPQGGAASGNTYVVNPSNGLLILTGTPTTPGTYTFTASGYQYVNRTGPVTTGTTSIVVAAAPNAAPAITRQPAAQIINAGNDATLTVGYTANPAPAFQWAKEGVPIAGATSANLTLANASAADSGAYAVTLTNSLGSTKSTVAQLTVSAAPAAPTFSAAPQSQITTAGGAAIFTTEASGVPSPALQWLRDGTIIAGATASTLILNDVQLGDGGLYSVVARNASGSVTSPVARLTVNAAAAAPAFIFQPTALSATRGSFVVLGAGATGTPSPSYQWQRDGANLPGATNPTLVLRNATEAGVYTVVATNSSGSVASEPAALTLLASGAASRLVNLSILSLLAPGETMTLGTVLGGAGTGGTKALLVRAAGPSLTPLGVDGVLPDPNVALVRSGGATVAINDDWSGTAALNTCFAQVGAFGFVSATSKDAALLESALPAGGYTIQVRDNGAVSGTVIAELYDATPAAAVTATTPRLVNVSVLKQIATGTSLTTGFVLGGTTARTVLIRAIGPGLAQFGVGGVMADPLLTLFRGTTKIAENDNWGGAPELTEAGNSVGAFAVAGADSKDAILLLTLPAGTYSAQVSGPAGGGAALVEIYEIP